MKVSRNGWMDIVHFLTILVSQFGRRKVAKESVDRLHMKMCIHNSFFMDKRLVYLHRMGLLKISKEKQVIRVTLFGYLMARIPLSWHDVFIKKFLRKEVFNVGV